MMGRVLDLSGDANKTDGRILFGETESVDRPIEKTETSNISEFNEVLANTLGLPVDAITSALNTMGAEINTPVGGSESIKKALSESGVDIADNDGTPEDRTIGAVEAAATIGSSALAEPVAGVLGIKESLNPFSEEGSGAKEVEEKREAITILPKTESGQRMLNVVSEAVKPIGEKFSAAENFLGERTLEATGSPALAAATKTIPTALTELLGFTVAKGVSKTKGKAKELSIAKEIGEATPSIDQLKDASRSVYKEIDNLGVTVHPKAYEKLVAEINRITKKGGLDKQITPDTAKVLERFNELKDKKVTLTELDTLRKVAQNAAGSLKKTDAALSANIINKIDDFLDQGNTGLLSGSKEAVDKVGKRYKIARDLWGRARRSEVIQEAFNKARLQASGFENGIRTQFRSILNNKKQRKFFNAEELAAMRRVVQGSKKENLAKLVGRLGFSEGNATNIVGGTIGVAGGHAVAGGAGAVIVPLVGHVSRKLAQRMTAKNAEFVDQVVRAGKDANKIAEAYIKNTPRAERSAEELSQLLMKTDIDLSTLPLNVLSIQAAKLVKERRAAIIAAAASGAAASSVAAEEQVQSFEEEKK